MSILIGLAALAATAYAHGTVSGIVADGVYNQGFKLDYYYAQKNGQAIPPNVVGWYAENTDNGFIAPSDYASPDIICHKNAKNAAASAKVAAGGKVSFEWPAWPASHVGPVITYAANCGGDCTTVDKTALKWVKIDAGGYDNGKWAVATMIANNNTWDATVPKTLAAGKYVFRHEIIALHSAGSEGGAQNYPQCFNVEVTGSGTDNPEGTLGTALYKSADPGIVFNVYAQNLQYTIPGPALYGGGSTGGAAPAAPASPASSAASAASPTAAKSVTTPSAAPSKATGASPSAAPSKVAGAEKTYTLQEFIAMLEKAAGSSSKVKRVARDFAA